MKRALLLVVGLLLLSCGTSQPPETEEIPPDSPADTGGPTHDYVTVDLEDGTSPRVLEKPLDITLEGSPRQNPESIYSVRVSEGGTQHLVNRIYENDLQDYVENIEESVRVTTFGANKPNDPLYPFQWNLDQIETQHGWTLSRGEKTVVAVVDTGVSHEDIEHDGYQVRGVEDLEGTSIVEGYNFDKDMPEAYDVSGHGTHVAGTVAQTTNNKYGVAGVAYNSSIMPVRVLNENGRGTSADIAKGVRFAANQNADVINLSLGAPKPSEEMEEAMEYAKESGSTIVAAAGNSGKREPSYPAAYDSTIAVAATQYDETTTFYSQKGEFVDIAAPGGNTKVDQNDDGRPDGVMQETVKAGSPSEHDFTLYMGTSMAAPHVSAVAAQLNSWGINHPDAVEYFLKKGSKIPGEDDDDDDEEDDDEDIEGLSNVDANGNSMNEAYGEGIIHIPNILKSSQFRMFLYRLLAVLILAISLFVYARREKVFEASARKTFLYLGAAIFTAIGLSPLFIIPYSLEIQIPHWLKLIFLPFPEWDVLIKVAYHQNPLTVSAALPALAIFLSHGHRIWKYLACGFAMGIASFNVVEVIFLSSDVFLIPGIGWWDRMFLLVNAGLCAGLTYLSLLNKEFADA